MDSLCGGAGPYEVPELVWVLAAGAALSGPRYKGDRTPIGVSSLRR
jgi:hypothetical protein